MKTCLARTEDGHICGRIIPANVRRCDSHKRSYSGAWGRRSLLERADHPLCADHLARNEYVPATEVHHIVKLSLGGDMLPTSDGLITLCHSCHSKRTIRGE